MPINSFLYPAPTNSNTYEVANSLRFDDGSSDYLIRTPASAGNQSTWTYSVWIKRGNLGSGTAPAYTLLSGDTASNYGDMFRLREDKFNFRNFSNSTNYYFSDRLYRDTSAWYHFVIKYDGANSVVQLYVNGELEGSVSIGLNENSTINDNEPQMIGAWQSSSPNNYFDGYMAEAVMVDGQALDPTSFGEFDADSGIWKPKNVSGLTFGTNGFYLDFENSGSLGADVSGNGNNFTVNNLTAIDQSLDTPTNSYCTFMYNHPSVANFTLTEGGLKVSKSGAATFGLYGSSIMPSAGKWYWEVKFVVDGGSDRTRAGVAAYESVTGTSTIQGSFSGFEFTCSTSGRFSITENGTTTEIDGFNGYATGDIIRFALDMDNTKLYIGRNGDWFNYSSSATGGDPTSGSGWCTNSAIALAGPVTVYAGHSVGASGNSELQYNFGSPPYAISSGNSDGNGHGNFEYAVPSGYYALNTKNLAVFG